MAILNYISVTCAATPISPDSPTDPRHTNTKLIHSPIVCQVVQIWISGAGLLGSLVYIRMLGSSVDSLKTNGAKGLVKEAIGQPRLLVPVVLVMIYNRWNAIVTEYGSMHLELIPMLVGFFTYKIATFVQATEDAVTASVKKS